MTPALKTKLNKLLKIEKQKISTNYDCMIRLDPNDYNFENVIVDDYDVLNIPGTFEIIFPKLNDSIKLYLPYNINLIKPKDNKMSSTLIEFNFKAGEEILFGKIKKVETNIENVGKILENGVKYLIGDIEKQLDAVWRQLLTTDNIQLMHLSIILSQMYLSEDKTQVLRKTGEDYSRKFKSNSKESSHHLMNAQGFGFGYSNDAIVANISKDENDTNLTDIEKMVKGDYSVFENK